MRLRVLVVDDEELARRNLALLLRDDPDIAAVTECISGAEAIETVRRQRPDLMFLDVQMPECDGFDVLELLGRNQPRTTIFVTAYDDYALRAFEAGALDYLLKPFDDARFHRALARAKARLTLDAPHAAKYAERLVVKSRGRAVFVDVAAIDWIEAASYYACLHVGPDAHVLRRPLAELETDLDPDRFIRIHRSAIVNARRIVRLDLDANGDHQVVLSGGARIRVSRRYRKHLQDRICGLSEAE